MGSEANRTEERKKEEGRKNKEITSALYWKLKEHK
jgi:hypothetical protein